MTHTMHTAAAAAARVSRTFVGVFAKLGEALTLKRAEQRVSRDRGITGGNLAAERRDGCTPFGLFAIGYRSQPQASIQMPRLPAPRVALVLTQPLNWRPSMSPPAVAVP